MSQRSLESIVARPPFHDLNLCHKIDTSKSYSKEWKNRQKIQKNQTFLRFPPIFNLKSVIITEYFIMDSKNC